MPLKVVIAAKPELDALPEAVRALYVEKDGKWTLDGLVAESDLTTLKTKVGEFRDNNIAQAQELEGLRPLKDKFKDVDPEEYKTLKAKAKQLENQGVKTADDLKAVIDAAVKPLTDRLDASEKARQTAQQAADDSRFRELVSADATKAGVKAQSLRHVLREAQEKFELKDGTLKPRTGIKHPSDPLKELTTTDWLEELARTDDYLFGDSVGGGAANENRRGGGRQGVKELINPSPEEMGRNMDDIANGKIVVVRR